jgi:mandelamide amidase
MRERIDRRMVLKAGAAGAVASVPAFGMLSGCVSAGPPPSDSDLLAMSSPELLDAMRLKRVTAERCVTVALDRADRLRDLNAFIALDRAGALERARGVDAMRGAGREVPPLAGLPIVVKDNIDYAGLPTTGGTLALRDVRPGASAPALQRLVDAGAIVIGKTNLHELAFGITSTNLTRFAGPVKNPYDPTRIPGGSSGGTAVAIAAHVVASGLGSDTGGSTRIPAALCGIVGLRPSVGNGGADRRYDPRGVVPISHTRDTIGPMGRTVADVALLDAVITNGPASEPAVLSGLRIGIPASFWSGLEAQVADVCAQARAKLAAAGVVFVDVDTVGLAALNEKVSFPVALHEPIADIPAYLAANGVTGIGIREIAAQIASPDVKGAFGAILADALGAGYADAINVQRPRMQALYGDYFQNNRLDAMLFPTTVAAAVPIDLAAGSGKFMLNGTTVDTFATMIRNTDPGSNAGIPGLAMPAGMGPTGLPIGIELDGPLRSDRRLIAIALAFEKVLGRVPAPPA